jgi:endonuclease/exonuclease/phosphatase family metal-dependent hydrolase
MRRKMAGLFTAFMLVASLVLAMGGGIALADDHGAVTIMAQNMDAGTDLSYIVALLGSDPQLGVDLTLAEIQASNIPQRADLLATQIAAEAPQIIALQEATLWRIGPTPATATTVLYDQLDLLLAALSNHGVPYEIVAVNRLADVALPGNSCLCALRFTDRDALLMRADLRPPAFHISNVHARMFQATFNFAGLQVPAGWISAEIRTANKHFHLATTHLQGPIPGILAATDVQVAQARELIWALRNLPVPVVLAGDFNSDANFGSGPDATPSAAIIEAAGYADTWKLANPGDPGPTWPL